MKKMVFPAAIVGGFVLSATGQQAYAATGQDVVAKAMQYQGTPYSYGAQSFVTSSFDCSSFTQYIYKDVYGITLPRTSAQQATVGVPVDQGNLQVGDLLFFDSSGDGGIHHVGIYMGNGQMISAELTVGVHVTNVFSGGGSQVYWQPRFVKARRVIGTIAGAPAPQQTSDTSSSSSTTPSRSGQNAGSYTVKSGDSLWKIASSHGTTVSAIKAANGLKSDTIYPGQTLALSGTSGSSGNSSKNEQPAVSNVSTSSANPAIQKTGSNYTVKRGDSLWKIAQAQGMSVSALKSLNHLSSDMIYIGQNLQLSGAPAPAAAVQKDQTSQSAASGHSKDYHVKKGDSLWTIATLHSITVNKLMRANNLTATLIYPGQHLIIPQ
ncbi:MAG: LysM peptidoglycan-binding domain-containing protein [Sporolactobacillus sp.]